MCMKIKNVSFINSISAFIILHTFIDNYRTSFSAKHTYNSISANLVQKKDIYFS